MFDDRTTRRLTDQEVLLEAGFLGIEVSGLDVAALRAAVSAERGRRWLEENAEAIAAHKAERAAA